MAEYAFVTRWRVHAPLEAVWDAIVRVEQWPAWWRAIAAAELTAPGDPQTGIGRTFRLTWRTALPYGFVFDITTTRNEPQRLLEGRSVGQLEGVGLWTFTPEGDTTLLRYDWNVRTNVAWMNLLAWFLGPAFRYNHDTVMRWGAEGLAKRLGAPVEEQAGT